MTAPGIRDVKAATFPADACRKITVVSGKISRSAWTSILEFWAAAAMRSASAAGWRTHNSHHTISGAAKSTSPVNSEVASMARNSSTTSNRSTSGRRRLPGSLPWLSIRPRRKSRASSGTKRSALSVRSSFRVERRTTTSCVRNSRSVGNRRPAAKLRQRILVAGRHRAPRVTADRGRRSARRRSRHERTRGTGTDGH